jgi:hypothetical protein
MRSVRWLKLVMPLVAAAWLSHAALAQAPSDEELETFVDIFIALQENARPRPPGESDDRRGSHEVIEAHGWTLERYNRLAQQVNSTPALFERFQALVEERS